MSMTDPLPGKEPAPLAPPAQPITGDSHRHLIVPLVAHAAEHGSSVEIRDLPEDGPGGWCDSKRPVSAAVVVRGVCALHGVRVFRTHPGGAGDARHESSSGDVRHGDCSQWVERERT